MYYIYIYMYIYIYIYGIHFELGPSSVATLTFGT